MSEDKGDPTPAEKVWTKACLDSERAAKRNWRSQVEELMTPRVTGADVAPEPIADGEMPW